ASCFGFEIVKGTLGAMAGRWKDCTRPRHAICSISYAKRKALTFSKSSQTWVCARGGAQPWTPTMLVSEPSFKMLADSNREGFCRTISSKSCDDSIRAGQMHSDRHARSRAASPAHA